MPAYWIFFFGFLDFFRGFDIGFNVRCTFDVLEVHFESLSEMIACLPHILEVAVGASDAIDKVVTSARYMFLG